MSSDAQLFFDEHYGDIDARIAAALARYKPNLEQARGELNPTRYPTPTGNAPGGYTPSVHAASHHSGGSDPLDLGALAGTLTDGQHGSRGGGSLHAAATTSVAGFMAAADKTKLDGITAGAAVASVGATAPLQSSGGTTPTISLANQSANTVLAGPTIGGPAAPAFRALVAADIPSLDSAKITSGEIPRSPLTTRGDLLAGGVSGHVRLAIGAAGRYLRSDGTDPSWHTLDFGDLTYSGLTTGQMLRATGTTAAAFGALDLANANAVTGVLPAANGGTGTNNSTRTLTISSNAGTLAFSVAASTLTIPATGTAALLGTAQTFSETNAFEKILRIPVTSGTTGYGIRINDGATDYGNWQALNRTATSTSYIFFSTNRQYDGSNWQTLNSRAGASLQIAANDTLEFLTFPASSATPTQMFSISNAGDVHAAGVISGDSYIGLLEISAPSAPAANGGRLYLEDNGAGKTRLVIKFNSGAAQVIATQP